MTELSSVVYEMAYNGNIEPYIAFFVEKFLKRLSNRDLIKFDEKYVKVMMLSSLFFSNLYNPVSEQESIDSYSDIYLEKKKAFESCHSPFAC